MKNRVDFGMRRKCQFVCHWTDSCRDLKGTVVARGEFVCRVLNQGLLLIWIQFKIHPVTHQKFPFSFVLITLLLHTFLGNGQMGFQKSEELVTGLESQIHSMNNSCA